MHAPFKAEEGASKRLANPLDTGTDLIPVPRPARSFNNKLGKCQKDSTSRKRDYDVLNTDSIALPVKYGRRNDNPRWELFDSQVLKDILDAERKKGLSSTYFKKLLGVIFSNYNLVLFDCTYTASTIFTDSQLMLWDARWRRALLQLKNRYAGGPHAGISLARLARDDLQDKLEDQAAELPEM